MRWRRNVGYKLMDLVYWMAANPVILAVRFHRGDAMDKVQLTRTLIEMSKRAISIQLTWGEDTGYWECHWINDDDVHISGLGKTPQRAVEQCLQRGGFVVPAWED